MSIYGSVVFNESYNYGKPVITDTIESIMEDSSIPLKDENEDFVNEGLEAVATMSENYSNFMQRVGVSELAAIYTTGEEMIYTESVVGDFLGSIKRFLMKIWEKIKGLFKRFIMIIDSYTKNDKAFINKYRQQIYRHKSLSDFTFKGYKYHIIESEITAAIEKITTVTSSFFTDGTWNKDQGTNKYTKAERYSTSNTYDQSKAGKTSEKLDDEMEELRGEILTCIGEPKGKAGKYTAEEFRKELDELLRKGESEKQELDDKDIDVDDMVTEVQNARQTKKTINDIFRTNKKSVDQNIKDAERAHRDHTKNMPVKDIDEKDKKTKDTITPDDILAGAIQWSEITNTQVPTIGNNDSENVKKEKAAEYYNSGKLASAKNTSKITAAQMSTAIKVTNAGKAMLLTLDSCVLKALKDRNRQYKACLVKIVYHNPKNESYNESYDYGDYNNYNFISNIQFK